MDDPETDELVAEFAAELRKLRIEAGEPAFRSLAHSTGYGRTTLHDALRGNRLPTLDVTLGLIRALGGSVDDWRARWVAVRGALDARQPPPSGTTPHGDVPAGGNAGRAERGNPKFDSDGQGPRDRPKRRRTLLTGALALTLLAGTVLVINLATRDDLYRVHPDHCEPVRLYRITESGKVLASHGEFVGATVPGDMFKAVQTSGEPYYRHRYYGIVLPKRMWGYVDEKKLKFVSETCL